MGLLGPQETEQGTRQYASAGLLGELYRRRVFRVAFTYMIVAWLMVQVADALAPALRLPEWAVAFIVYLLVLCFPIALILAWAYDAGPKGIVATETRPGTVMPTPRHMLLLGTMVIAATLILFGLLSVTLGGLPARADAAPWQSGELRERSIAVIPFVDHSPGGGQAWLAEGLGQELLLRIPSIQGIRVAQVNAGQVERAGGDYRELGRQLDVKTLLTGNVQRVGVRVRVNVRLVDVVSGYQAWSGSYEGDVEDVFDFQTRLTEQIVDDLSESFENVPVAAGADSAAN